MGFQVGSHRMAPPSIHFLEKGQLTVVMGGDDLYGHLVTTTTSEHDLFMGPDAIPSALILSTERKGR